jgi:putative hydroxymethylpyrimidine transport system substrate-binding protein
MTRIAASLAVALGSLALGACGGGDAEPDAPVDGAAAPPDLELVLDFQPNAVHTGIYAASRRGLLAERGVELRIREPGASTDAPKLLRSGRADLAILDIHDLAIARERGGDLVAVGAIVHRPLAAVIAADAEAVRSPADLRGRQIGVTGLPSDDAVLASVLEAGGLEHDDVRTVTVGFEAVPALLNGRLDAATAFWNAEGVTLAGRLDTREFRVEDFGAPTYPELVVVTTAEKLAADRDAIAAAVAGIGAGYEATLEDPETGLADLLAAVPGLEPDQQREQLEAVRGAFAPSPALDRAALEEWARWDLEHGVVDELPDVGAAFDFELAER